MIEGGKLEPFPLCKMNQFGSTLYHLSNLPKLHKHEMLTLELRDSGENYRCVLLCHDDLSQAVLHSQGKVLKCYFESKRIHTHAVCKLSGNFCLEMIIGV